MGLTVNDVIDRTLNEWLYNAGANRPRTDTLTGGITADAMSFTVEGRAEFIAPNSQVEIGSELIQLSGYDETTNVATVAPSGRGMYESSASAHLAGELVSIGSDYPRITLFNHVVSVIHDLYPMGLYDRALVDVFYNDREVTDLPAGTMDVLSAVTVGGAAENWIREMDEGKDFRVYRQFTPPRVQMLRGGSEGDQVRLVTRKDFAVPALFTTDLDDCGVPASLQARLPMAVAGYALMGKEVPRVIVEEIKTMLAAMGAQIPVGAVLNVGQALLGFFQSQYVAAERRRLLDLDPPKFRYVQ